MTVSERAGARMCCAAQPHVDLVEVLLSAYPFRDLTPAELSGLHPGPRLLHVDRDSPVFRAGEPATDLYVVVDGQLKERTLTHDGDEAVTELFTSGAVFGEPGLFVPEADRVVDVVALQAAHVVALSRDALVALLASHPGVALRLLEGLASDVRALTVQLTHASYLRVRDRVAAKLLELASTHGSPQSHGTRIQLALTQSTLAGMVAATRENTSRALGELAALGALELGREGYTVHVQALQGLALSEPPLPRRNRAMGLHRG